MGFFFEDEEELIDKDKLKEKINSTRDLLEFATGGFNITLGLLPLSYILNSNELPWITYLIALDLILLQASLDSDLGHYFENLSDIELSKKTDEECYKILDRQKVNIEFCLLQAMKIATTILTFISLNYMLNFSLNKIVLYLTGIVSSIMLNSVTSDIRINYKKNSSIKDYCKNRLGVKHNIIDRQKNSGTKFIKKR